METNATGHRIRSRRKELGMTQEELAKKCGFSTKGSISNIEIGKRDVTIETVKQIAKALDVTPEYLLCWDMPEDYATELGAIIEVLPQNRQEDLLRIAKMYYEELKNEKP